MNNMEDSVKIVNLPHKQKVVDVDTIKLETWHRNNVQVREDGIYQPCVEFSGPGTESNYKLLMSKEDFIKAYKLYIEESADETPEPENNLPDKDEYFKSKFDKFGAWGSISTHSEPCFKCPKCGGNVRKNLGMVLTSYPPQYRYECENCDYATTGI